MASWSSARGRAAAAGAQGGGGVCECVSVGGRVYASGGLRPVVTYERYAECPDLGTRQSKYMPSV